MSNFLDLYNEKGRMKTKAEMLKGIAADNWYYASPEDRASILKVWNKEFSAKMIKKEFIKLRKIREYHLEIIAPGDNVIFLSGDPLSKDFIAERGTIIREHQGNSDYWDIELMASINGKKQITVPKTNTDLILI